MYASAFPGLSLEHFVGPQRPLAPYPLSAPRQQSYFRARNALFHLLRALGVGEGDIVIAPDWHHGNEVAAARALGADLRFFPISRTLEPDLDALRQLCRQGAKAILAIHFVGWPQPIESMAAIAREFDIPLIEDCALAMLSERDGKPLGSFGDWSLFCLYKTLPIPNGALLVDNGNGTTRPSPASRSCGFPSVAARTVERINDWVLSYDDRIGRPVQAAKRAFGKALTQVGVRRYGTFDSGFAVDAVDLRMSGLSSHLLPRFDYAAIRQQRRDNFIRMKNKVAGRVTALIDDLPEGVCPLFFPALIGDKRSAAETLQARGVDAIEFWNEGDPASRHPRSDAEVLRRHVLEVPLHQGLTEEHIDFVAEELIRAAGPRFTFQRPS